MASPLEGMSDIYFANAELSAIAIYFLFNQDIIHERKLEENPKSLFFPHASPDLSKSTDPFSIESSPPTYLRLGHIFPSSNSAHAL